MDEERELILQVFETQCEDGLSRMEEALLALEARTDDDEALNSVFRICHTIKGDSDILGFSQMAAFAHVLEDLLESVRQGHVGPSEALISLLLEARDALGQLARHALDGGEAKTAPNYDDLLQRLQVEAGEAAADAVVAEQQIHDAPEAVGEQGDQFAFPHLSASNRTIRVRVDTLDRLVDLTGELAIGRSRITQLLGNDDSAIPGEFREAHHALDRLFAELHEEVMKVRMVPVGPVFRQHLRTVRDTALSLGKRARLEIWGADAELDTTVIEHLRDCLGHMVRNSVSHGIESPERRESIGKPPYGTITLGAQHQGPNLVVEISDDGAGLKTDEILAHSRRLGLVGETEQLADAQIHAMIFEPGFSTAGSTTRTSGRGVGMDVVRRKIESLGGSVSIESRPGLGTTITLCLPLTLAIVEGFAVGVADEVYVLPLNSVVECIDLTAGEGDRNNRLGGVINVRGKALPFLRLREILGSETSAPRRESIVVIRHNDTDAGIAVDGLHGERQAVIKPLGKLFRDLPGIAGATILGDGQVALILDIPALMRMSTDILEGSGGANFSGPPGSSPRSEIISEGPSAIA